MPELTSGKRKALILFGLLILLTGTTLFTMQFALEKDRVYVPHVVGATAPLAMERLKEHNLQGKIAGDNYHLSFPKGSVITQDPPPGARIKARGWVSLTISRGSNELFLPDFAMQPKDKVRRYMGAKGLALGDLCQAHSGVVPLGIIMAQSPPPGTKVHISDTVSLLVSLGSSQPVYLMPDLVGREGTSISKALMAMGFKVQTNLQASSAKDAGRIMSQKPPHGSPIAKGERIVLGLGKEDRTSKPGLKL